MSSMIWAGLLNAGQYNQTNAGTALANSTTLTDVSPGANNAGQAFSFLGGSLIPGMRFRVGARGIVSTTTGTNNLTLGVYWGGVAGAALATTGAIAAAASLTNQLWRMTCDIRVVSVGPAGSMYAQGEVIGPYATVSTVQFMPVTSASGNLVASLNTGSNQILTVGAQWGTASASNSVQVIDFTVESLGF